MEDRISAYFQARGRQHLVINGVVWTTYNHMIVPFAPASRRVELNDRDVKFLFDNLPGQMVRWTSGFQDKTSPWWSVVCRRSRPIDEYASKSVRNSIRRAFKDAQYRLIDPIAEVEEIHRVYQEANARHGIKATISLEESRNYFRILADFPDVTKLYGVYTDDRLAGLASMYLFGGEAANFSEIKLAAEGLKHNRSYGLIHFINTDLVPKHGYTNDGYRSILHDSSIQRLLIDKLHFERAFTRLEVRYRPPLKMFVTIGRLMAPIVEKADARAGALLLQDRISDNSRSAIYDLFEFTASSPSSGRIAGMRVERSSLGTSPMHLYWRLMSRGRAACYRAIAENGTVSHTTYVLPKMPRLSFMQAADWQIGPAFTPEKFRGRGIYQWMIGQIVQDLQARGAKGRILMFASNQNEASTRGILNAGFTRVGLVRKVGIIRSYKLIASFL